MKYITDTELYNMLADSIHQPNESMRLALAELKQRRAADLSAEERDALAFVRREVDEEIPWTTDRETKQLRRTALAALDKLLGGKHTHGGIE